MRALVVGGGPGGLYAAALLKKIRPGAEVRVVDRNPADATYGWGVVFSEQTLSALGDADRATYDRIVAEFAHWDAIDVHFKGEHVRAHGHGFAGLSRHLLLRILQERCAELGVELRFETEVTDSAMFGEFDLVIAADGVNSMVRQTYERRFSSRYDTRKAKFVWWGTDKRPDAFTYMVKPTRWGTFQATMYPFDAARSTFIVECSDDTWRSAGLDTASEAESKTFCENLFAELLDGCSLLANRSSWLSFTTVRNASWHHDNIVLLGDAAHTAHFSIGSGTKLAMEDAIYLVDGIRRHDTLGEAIIYYERSREVVVEAIQEAAQQSLEWFENLDRSLERHPLQFTFNFLTRSGRISYDNVRERDPKFGDAFDRWYASTAARLRSPLLVAPSPLFTEHHFQDVSVANRAVFAVGSALGAERGVPSRAYLEALMHRAQGGAGLVMTDVLAVDPSGAISPADAGLYSEDCAGAWQEIVLAVRETSDAKLMASIGHAGSRGATAPRTRGVDRPLARGAWPLISASGLRYTDRAQSPREMVASDMAVVCQQFCSAAARAAQAGFDLLELHAGHGYLLSSFLSPLTNKREDEYGGDLEGRLRFPLEVLAGVRARWSKPLAVCFTAHDCVRGGNTDAEAVEIARAFRERGCDLVRVVAGQTVARGQPGYERYFLAPYAERVRNEAHIPVLVGGRINSIDDANTVLAGGRADLCVIDLPGLSEFDQQTTARLDCQSVQPASLHEVAVS